MIVTRTPREMWSMPLIMAMVSALGLTSALLGDDVWDYLSWLALAAPLAVIGWHLSHPPHH